MNPGQEAQRAVYELLERGPISARRAALYEDTLLALVAARLARRTPEGGYVLTAQSIAYEDETELLTLTLPAECVARLDRMAPTRGEAIAIVIRERTGSGVWRKR